ncbi:eCIS core domain-containing protein [Deinococcus arcticus]|uniref:eCIS core domain-containing protein n=1 Tax=Deinococcus arcticus TaxID=2136176 RepID=UPI001E5847B4|nr:DUF4157 domain-containing protein [Deinococcus arcticus]
MLRAAALQRQLAELNAEATQPVFQRIQARRGAGNPLPEAIQRHLEQGLNHDLSRVRIHDDPEAHQLAKGVNALAFTTGSDIFFQAGQFNLNSQSGLELLAHEVTHTVQQSQGKVGPGIDPDAGLEAEARQMGHRLARGPLASPDRGLRPVATPAARGTGALQRRAAPTTATPALLQTLSAGQAPPVPFAFVWQTEDGGVFLRETPGGKVLGKVPNTTRLQLLRHDPKQGLYAVRTPSGLQGWVAASHLKIPPPRLAEDANLKFYVPRKGEGIFKVVTAQYGAAEFGEDARYFTNVLRAVNQPSAFKVTNPKYKSFLEGAFESAITAMTAGRDANGVQLQEDVPFWLPSPKGAADIKAYSGSFTKGVLETTKQTFGTAGEQALYTGSFMTGMQLGVLQSIWDALVGLVELVKLPLTIVKAIYGVIQTALQGHLLAKIGEIYAFLAGGGLKQIAELLIADFKAGWNNQNPLSAWTFRGRVIGYAVTEILMTFIPIAGLVLKAAKAGKVASFLGGKFKWIGQAGQKAMQALDKVQIQWPPPGFQPQRAAAGIGGISIPVPVEPNRKISLGQVLRSVGNAVGGAAQGGGRVRAPVAGLYKGLDVANPPQGWKFKDNVVFGVDAKSITTVVTGPKGQSGTFTRKYAASSVQLIFDVAFLQDLPSWIPSASGELAAGKGVPTVAYVSMYQMKRLGIGYGSLKTLKMSTIQNFETILFMESKKRQGIPLNKSVLQSHSVAYAETTMIQSGHEIVSADVSGGQLEEVGDYMAFYERRNPALKQIHDDLLKKYGLSRRDRMLIDFNIELKLKGLPEGQTALPLGSTK